MFKDLIPKGSNPSSAFMNLAESLLGGFMSSSGARNVINAVTRVVDVVDSFKPEVKIKDAKMQTSTYGRLIPEIFGNTRVSGNIIWSSPIITIKRNGTGMPIVDKLSSILSVSAQSVQVRCSFAIALGVGMVDSVNAIYADGNMLNLSSIDYTFYNGSEIQQPNSVIQSYIGPENTPAFRGLAYIVFEDFKLEEYNGRIPNLSFDVSRYKMLRSPNTIAPEDLVTGVNLIPGSGHFVYDTKVQYQYKLGSLSGYSANYRISQNEVINQNNNEGKSDFELSIDHLKRDMPNVQWVSIVFTWFTNSLDLSSTEVYPAYEFRVNETEPSKWSVAGIIRETAKIITHNGEGDPIYGGTVSDDALVRGIKELKKRGYKVCAYPMIFVDQLDKPWRGKISGNHKDVQKFFEGNKGYNHFIMHYANLLNGMVDAFIIGSEFVKITSIKDEQGLFVGVDYFVKLAKSVKSLMGQNTKITYAADWSEYHHTDGGWFNMDELWSSPYIDMIGIDAYFPITNSGKSTYDIDKIKKGWESGEGYDFYYKDSVKKTNPTPLSPKYAWKNMEYFWSNVHVNPDGKKTKWKPKMKKIWFTEYGFPSVDCATNQPNVFYSTDSIEGGFPHLSDGRVDFKAQRNAIYATEQKWLNSSMVEQKMLWTWDARPYPFFPSLLNVWKDGPIWKYGHFLNGKIGYSRLGDIIVYLCGKVGIEQGKVNADGLDIDIGGYIIDDKTSALKHINLLADIFSFDAYVKDDIIIFQKMEDYNIYNIDIKEVIEEGGNIMFLEKTLNNQDSIPDAVELLFQNIEDEYRIGVVRALNITGKLDNIISYNLGISTTTQGASDIASNILASRCVSRSKYQISLPMSYSDIIPSDIIKLKDADRKITIRVISVNFKSSYSIEIEGVSDDVGIYELPNVEIERKTNITVGKVLPVVETSCDIIQVHPFDSKDSLENPFVYCSIYSMYKDWSGVTMYKSEDNGETYEDIGFISKQNPVGVCVTTLSNNIDCSVKDRVSKVDLYLYDNGVSDLFWVNEQMWLDNYNFALIGSELVSFQSVKVIGKNHVMLEDFLRGRFGTEKFISSHKNGEKFTLLKLENLLKVDFSHKSIDSKVIIVARSRGQSMQDAKKIEFTLKNYSNIDLLPVKFETKKTSKGITIKWNSRPRSEKSFFDDADKEDFANYNFIISDHKGNPVRKIFVPKNGSANYTNKMQIEDFNSLVDDLKIID